MDSKSPFASATTQVTYGTYFLFASLFVVVGFGMLFSYFKSNSAAGMLASLFTVSITLILSPLLQKLWFNILVGRFG